MTPDERLERRKAVARAAIRETAWKATRTCEECRGSGTVEDEGLTVHTRIGSYGADWPLDGALQVLDASSAVDLDVDRVVIARPGEHAVSVDVRWAVGQHPGWEGRPPGQPYARGFSGEEWMRALAVLDPDGITLWTQQGGGRWAATVNYPRPTVPERTSLLAARGWKPVDVVALGEL